jgi:hypothetical protein
VLANPASSIVALAKSVVDLVQRRIEYGEFLNRWEQLLGKASQLGEA